MTLSYRDGVAVGQIVVYVPALLIAVFLFIRHGVFRSSGWLYLITFTLSRIIGPIFQLLLLRYPTSVDLITGATILLIVGLSPLMTTGLGLLHRSIGSISRHHCTFPGKTGVIVIHVICLAGVACGVVGVIEDGNDINKGLYVPKRFIKIAVILFIVGYILIILTTIFTSFHIKHADLGEKRTLLAVALTLPFFLVRFVYTILSTFDTSSRTFNLVYGNVTVWLVMVVIVEVIIVVIYESCGLTLRKVSHHEHSTAGAGSPRPPSDQRFTRQGQPGYNPGQQQGQQAYHESNGAPTKEGYMNDVEMQRQPDGS